MNMLNPEKRMLENSWEKLLEVIRAVITLKWMLGETIWNNTFKEACMPCLADTNNCKQLYKKTRDLLKSHIRQIYNDLENTSDENLLTLYYQFWTDYSIRFKYLNNLLIFLNIRLLGMSNSDQGEHFMEIREMAHDCWLTHMVEPLKGRLKPLMLETIKQHRCNKKLDQSLICGVIISLFKVGDKSQESLELNKTLFEKEFIEQTREYYRKKANKYLSFNDKPLAPLKEENLHIRNSLDSNTNVNKEAKKELVDDNLDFLHAECRDLLNSEFKQDLKNMYERTNHVSKSAMLEAFQNHITRASLDVIPTRFFEQIMQIHSKYSEWVKELFQSNTAFQNVVDKICLASTKNETNQEKSEPVKKVVQNNHDFKNVPEKIKLTSDNQNSIPQMSLHDSERVIIEDPLLANYCDSLLRNSFMDKKLTEKEIDNELHACIVFFKYLQKNYFMKSYGKELANRLINGYSISMYAEANMIKRMRKACGQEFIDKFLPIMLTGMIEEKSTRVVEQMHCKCSKLFQNDLECLRIADTTFSTNKLHRMFTDKNTNEDRNKTNNAVQTALQEIEMSQVPMDEDRSF